MAFNTKVGGDLIYLWFSLLMIKDYFFKMLTLVIITEYIASMGVHVLMSAKARAAENTSIVSAILNEFPYGMST